MPASQKFRKCLSLKNEGKNKGAVQQRENEGSMRRARARERETEGQSKKSRIQCKAI